MEAIEELKESLKKDRFVYGTEQTLKSLKSGRINKVFISSNCHADVKKDILHYCDIAEAKHFQLEIPNSELGVMCKKPFSVSVLGVLK